MSHKLPATSGTTSSSKVDYGVKLETTTDAAAQAVVSRTVVRCSANYLNTEQPEHTSSTARSFSDSLYANVHSVEYSLRPKLIQRPPKVGEVKRDPPPQTRTNRLAEIATSHGTKCSTSQLCDVKNKTSQSAALKFVAPDYPHVCLYSSPLEPTGNELSKINPDSDNQRRGVA